MLCPRLYAVASDGRAGNFCGCVPCLLVLTTAAAGGRFLGSCDLGRSRHAIHASIRSPLSDSLPIVPVPRNAFDANAGLQAGAEQRVLVDENSIAVRQLSCFIIWNVHENDCQFAPVTQSLGHCVVCAATSA